MNKLYQPFHLVTLSPWPLIMSFSIMVTLYGVVNWFNNLDMIIFFYGNLLVVLSLYQWWRDVVRESTFQGFHTKKVIKV